MTNKTYLGIELGSTRIKAVAVDAATLLPVAQGGYTWAARFENGVWTYDLSQAFEGLNTALAETNGLDTVTAVGVSGMMHGYLAFDKDWNLLAPFRTWQNTITAKAAEELTALFGFNVPQRWSVAHLYQAVLNGEDHIDRIAHITTLAGYVHYKLTGVNALGIGEASGVFPIDSATMQYDEAMMQKMEALLAKYDLPWNVRDVLPQVLVAGQEAGTLTAEGAALLDGRLAAGIPFAPPEGDMGTGMTATNSVAVRTGNVSAGTSINAMVVLEHPLSQVYEEIDIVTTPDGKSAALVHCNNCTNDTNAWASVLRETAVLFGANPSTEELYTKLYQHTLEGDADCGGVAICNYMAGEVIAHLDAGRPLVARRPDANFTLANFFRAQLYATMATLKMGMEILESEGVTVEKLNGHGGLFKTPVVGQRYMAAACGASVTCMTTAGEGGPYGMALLAAYMMDRADGEALDAFLDNRVFSQVTSTTLRPDEADVKGFDAYMAQFKGLLEAERAAVANM